uniref:RNase H type-1 domain-containing protein n=1 Tax=Lactuca sativa TaxID=4236 RepID=A0A9R1WSG7_LACSA|nr:hypothetical protein LSAT_V11C900479430 [Lactuca sativa]
MQSSTGYTSTPEAQQTSSMSTTSDYCQSAWKEGLRASHRPTHEIYMAQPMAARYLSRNQKAKTRSVRRGRSDQQRVPILAGDRGNGSSLKNKRSIGFASTKEGIQPSPIKVNELEETPSPYTLMDAQSLNGKLIALSRFISKSAEKAMPLFNTLKGCIEKNNFNWTTEAESALREIKKALHALPTLASPIPGEVLQVYLSMSKDAISPVLTVDRQGRQLPIYFVSRALQGPEMNYSVIDMCISNYIFSIDFHHLLANYLHIMDKRYLIVFKLYFQSKRKARKQKEAGDTIESLGTEEIRKLLKSRSYSVSRDVYSMSTHEDSRSYTWSPFRIRIPQGGSPRELQQEATKADNGVWSRKDDNQRCTLHTYGASSKEGSCAGLILTSPTREELTYALRFDFHTSNNKAEYEALLADLILAVTMGAERVIALTDSRLAANQVTGEFETKDKRMEKYVKTVQQITSTLKALR